jgi:hypothetical protein
MGQEVYARDDSGVGRWLPSSHIDSGGSVAGYEIVPFAWNTPNFVHGAPVLTIPDGQFLQDLKFAFLNPFDGTTPGILIGTAANPDVILTSDLSGQDTEVSANLWLFSGGFASAGVSGYYASGGDVDVQMKLTDGSGGDPGSTTGNGLIYYQLVS